MGDPANIVDLRRGDLEESVEESRQKPIEDYLAAGSTTADLPGLSELAPVRSFQPLLRELLLGGEDDF